MSTIITRIVVVVVVTTKSANIVVNVRSDIITTFSHVLVKFVVINFTLNITSGIVANIIIVDIFTICMVLIFVMIRPATSSFALITLCLFVVLIVLTHLHYSKTENIFEN